MFLSGKEACALDVFFERAQLEDKYREVHALIENLAASSLGGVLPNKSVFLLKEIFDNRKSKDLMISIFSAEEVSPLNLINECEVICYG